MTEYSANNRDLEKSLTIITTTYNRDYCIHQVYESLKRQTSKDFIWLVVDDGSSDNTRALIEGYIKENLVDIEYYYKENGGMHTARNLAYEKVHTELNMIVDSDDWLADDAVEKILTFWAENKNDMCYGMVSYNADPNGNLIGNKFPEEINISTTTELTEKYKVYGDKKLILKTEFSKLYPFPEFEGEKFFPASYKYKLLDQKHKLLIMREVTCIVDYNDDSMTRDKYRQYRTCPKGFAFYRNEMIRISLSRKFIVSNMIHYIAESKYAKEKHYIKKSSKRFYAILCLPIGLLYYLYLEKTNRRY